MAESDLAWWVWVHFPGKTKIRKDEYSSTGRAGDGNKNIRPHPLKTRLCSKQSTGINQRQLVFSSSSLQMRKLRH